jgi:hypothetical protein
MENELLNEILNETTELKKYMKVLSASAIMDLLTKIATTPERQQMWRLADGSRSNEEIAKQIGVTLRTVQYFIQESDNMGLTISEKRGYPKRIQDIFPKEWKPQKSSKEKQTAQSTTETSSEETT